MQGGAHLVAHRGQEHAFGLGGTIGLVPGSLQLLLGGHAIGNVREVDQQDRPILDVPLAHGRDLDRENLSVQALCRDPPRRRHRQVPVAAGQPVHQIGTLFGGEDVVQRGAFQRAGFGVEDARGGAVALHDPPLPVGHQNARQCRLIGPGHVGGGALDHLPPAFQIAPQAHREDGGQHHQRKDDPGLDAELDIEIVLLLAGLGAGAHEIGQTVHRQGAHPAGRRAQILGQRGQCPAVGALHRVDAQGHGIAFARQPDQFPAQVVGQIHVPRVAMTTEIRL